MWYNVYEVPPCSDLSIFASRGTTVGSSTSYYSTVEERKVALLYMYANIVGRTNILNKCLFYIYVNQYPFLLLASNLIIFSPYSEFHEQNWTLRLGG
jgi:hypothetical protein